MIRQINEKIKLHLGYKSGVSFTNIQLSTSKTAFQFTKWHLIFQLSTGKEKKDIRICSGIRYCFWVRFRGYICSSDRRNIALGAGYGIGAGIILGAIIVTFGKKK